MNEQDQHDPFPREPWKRLLEESADAPPETTDARIRAAARRDLAPRGRRWWLPASLAASFVLAVVIVRSELGTGGRVRIDESARGGDAAMDARIIDRSEGEQAREPGRSPAAAAPRESKQRAEPEPDVYGYAESDLGQESAGTAPRLGGPEHELKAASELPGEAPAWNASVEAPVVTVQRLPQPDEPVPSAPAMIAAPPTPEAWYAAIEKLRADGLAEEADRELERLKKAYPGWLEKHLKAQERR